ncbi:nitrate reductase cytochrome c-type subunit [Gilvimarinus agarilyticus]|uniref:nitrate reductase cytochrome c-type subunit n=1 Tax=Gilvimarinus agarilyticus TaxID=679259 RepID=UPI0005A09276|nr:nitrate reductase cytochrome c-type subunit [Gilvimarinus agarilyticus]
MKFCVLLLALLCLSAAADEPLNAPAPDGIRPGGTLADETTPPATPDVITPIKRPMRNYPEQPPTIPHSVRNYQITKNFNQCLTCHSRQRSPDTGAPMVSITHYWNREHQPLAAVSPRRYFCVQCHVPQHNVEPATGSDFKGIETVLSNTASQHGSESE